ncbi:outer membrane lipoprotein carrier protein LolA [Verrucomicrobiales bacterium]|nr:outer membrane lipoprotein carrier protein LolA [Verrucomicrobiales bacterium]
MSATNTKAKFFRMFTSDSRSALRSRKQWLCGVLVAVFSLATIFSASAADEGPLRAWLAEAAKDQTVEIGFLQERTVPSLDKPVSTKGRFIRYKNGGFLWELGKPPETILKFDGTKLTMEDRIDEETKTLSPSDPRVRPIFRFATARDPDAFFKTFSLIGATTENGVYTASLKPRNPTFARQVKSVILQIDASTNTINVFDVRQKSGARTLVRFAKPVVK